MSEIDWKNWIKAGVTVEQAVTEAIEADKMDALSAQVMMYGVLMGLSHYAALCCGKLDELSKFFGEEVRRGRSMVHLGSKFLTVVLNELGLIEECLKSLGVSEDAAKKAASQTAYDVDIWNMMHDAVKKVGFDG